MYNSENKLRLHGLEIFKGLFLDFSNPIPLLLQIIYFSYLISLSPHECSATYREHFVENEKICPDPLHLHSSSGVSEEFPKDTLLVNLPKTLSLFESVNDFPCNFASSTLDNQLRKVIVRAIHPSATSWNYTNAENCDYFIKFKRSESHHNKLHSAHSHKNEVICRVWKQHDEEFSREGSFYHPMIWNSPNNKMTLSFSTYDWEYKLENNNTILYKPTYLQMVFLVYGDVDCSLRVQQYLIDPMENLNTNCKGESSTMPLETYQHCGKYECTELKSILQSIRFRTYEIDDVEIANRKRLHEEQQQKELERLKTNQSNNNDNNNSSSSTQHSGNGKSSNGTYTTRINPTEETDRTKDLSTIEQYDIFKTTTKTVTFYNGSNSFWTNLSVSSIVIVPIIALILTILVIRCYISKCKSGYSSYDECENANLIVPSDHRHHHPVLMNTHVSEDGNVELDLDYDADAMPLYSSEQFSDSMDYIQPIDVRNMSLSTDKSPAISDPPSYETLAALACFGQQPAPPHYPGFTADDIII